MSDGLRSLQTVVAASGIVASAQFIAHLRLVP
jgi:hypothetical protein